MNEIESLQEIVQVRPAKQHVPFLDVLRGLAILGVVLTHVTKLRADSPVWLDNIGHFGSKGVQLFFVVSGYTLWLSYSEKSFSFIQFIIKRIFRIAPMYYLSAIAYAAIGTSVFSAVKPLNLSFKSWLFTFLFINGWSADTVNSFVPGGWSISDEFMFYLIFPIIFILRKDIRKIAFITIVSLATSVVCFSAIVRYMSGGFDYKQSFAYFFWLTQLPAFLIGIFLADIRKHFVLPHKAANYLILFSIAAITIAAFTRGLFSSYLAADGLFAILVFSAARSDLPIVKHKALKSLGLVSFSIYLIHFLVLSLFREYILGYLLDYSPAITIVIAYASVLAVSYLIACITYRYIELRCVKAGSNLARRLTKGRSHASF